MVTKPNRTENNFILILISLFVLPLSSKSDNILHTSWGNPFIFRFNQEVRKKKVTQTGNKN